MATGNVDGVYQLSEQAGDPANEANIGKIYTKDAGGITELFYIDSAGTVIQITGNGSLIHSLDQAYEDGNTINIDNAIGAVTFVGDANTNVILIDNGTTDATANKDIISIDLDIANGVSTIQGIFMDMDQTGNALGPGYIEYGIHLQQNCLATTNNGSLRGMRILHEGTMGSTMNNVMMFLDSNLTINSAASTIFGLNVDFTGMTINSFSQIIGSVISLDFVGSEAGNNVIGLLVDDSTALLQGRILDANTNSVLFAEDDSNITTAITRRGLYIDSSPTVNNVGASFYGAEIDLTGLTDTTSNEIYAMKMTYLNGLVMTVGGSPPGSQPQGFGVDCSGYDYFYQHMFNVLGTPNTNDWITCFSATNVTLSNNCTIVGLETNFTTAGAFNRGFMLNCYPSIDHNVTTGFYGMDYQLQVGVGATVTASYGLRILNFSGAGTVTTEIGAHLEGATAAVEVGSGPGGRWFDDGDMVLGGTAMSGTEKLRVVGDIRAEADQDMTGGAGNWFRPPQMTTAERNTMTGGWGAGDAGKQWYNTTTDQWEGWDGTQIVILG